MLVLGINFNEKGKRKSFKSNFLNKKRILWVHCFCSLENSARLAGQTKKKLKASGGSS